MSVEAIAAPAAPASKAGWQRWLVMLATTAGVFVAAYVLARIWTSPGTALKVQVYQSIQLATAVAMFAISWLIAWRAGDSIANLAMALAFTSAFMADTLSVSLIVFGREGTRLYEVVTNLTFMLGAGLFIRASQNFPRL